jgi:CRISPR-associated endonuclease/helicase Cas3
MGNFASYDQFFEAATGRKPFPYQQRLAEADRFPDLLRVETGCGKTAAVVLAWLWRRQKRPERTPRRLVYCLPTRALVEQTCENARQWIAQLIPLGLGMTSADSHILMGGNVDGDWQLHPDRDQVLIGTQDMLLSRALNRGYAESRFRWPISFGLLSTDSLWVFDEVQLMSTGLATSAQLAAFRSHFGGSDATHSLWMSATLDRSALETVDFADCARGLREESLSGDDRAVEVLARRLTAPKQLERCDMAPDPKDYAQRAAVAICEAHRDGTLTMAIVNTVERAQKLYEALKRSRRNGELLLIHSRFRPQERTCLNGQLTDLCDRVRRKQKVNHIVVATQVVEAGVDISAQTLFTELAPWPSLVQRFGRCNRYGESKSGRVLWVDLFEGTDYEGPSDRERRRAEKQCTERAAPYAPDELKEARKKLSELTGESVAPRDLPPTQLAPVVTHVLRRKDLLDLFDTTPDLSGNDIDVSRFIRETADHDVQVFWRNWPAHAPPPADAARPARDELCTAPIGEMREVVKKREAWVWDHLNSDWRRADGSDVRPGHVFLLHSGSGHYNSDTGWDLQAGKPVRTVTSEDIRTESEEGTQGDSLTFERKRWVTLPCHTASVVSEVQQLLARLSSPGLSEQHIRALLTAAEWHDVGKGHFAFQEMLLSQLSDQEKEERRSELWAKSDKRQIPNKCRPYFRHELAGALAFLANCDDGSLESDLTAYLVAAHHGKVRLAIRSVPEEKIPDEPDRRYALGVWDGDPLPAAECVMMNPTTLNLSLMEVGGDGQGRPSWLQRSLRLRDQLGPFRLAFLEALVRIADWRASAREAEGGAR